MVAACRAAMECRVHPALDFKTHDMFMGEIVHTWADPGVPVDGRIDLTKVDPLLFDFSSVRDWALGEPLDRCRSVGKALKNGS